MRTALRALSIQANSYFDEAQVHFKDYHADPFLQFSSGKDYWEDLTPELKAKGEDIITSTLTILGNIAEASKHAVLTSSEDTSQLRLAAKKLKAAVRFKRYYFHPAEVVHDEGRVLGFKQASQSEGNSVDPTNAKSIFNEYLGIVADILRNIEISQLQSGSGTTDFDVSQTVDGQKFRPGTAFLMMWMDPSQDGLPDVMDTVKSVFSSFNIRAVRADDIEHDGLISERVLNEIRSSEFLMADLTGVRPNVYYEIGYAHALGKRVIMFRKAGTDIHFDLAGYNCPEYRNLRDLRDKLTKRLSEMTSMQPKGATEI